MEEKDVKMLNSSKTSVLTIGKWMNIFSIFAVIAILIIVCGGLFLLYYSSTLPEDMAHYIDNLVGLGGIGLICVAGSIVPAVVLMRRAMHFSRHCKATSEVYPVCDFLRESRKLWHYVAVLLMALVAVSAICIVMLCIYFLPTLSTI